MNTQTEGNYDYPEEILNDESAFIYNQGCAITIVANMLNTMGFNNCTPSDVNSEEFINEEGNVKWGAIADRTKYVLERKNLQFTFELYDAQENDLENKYYTAIKVQYCTDANSPHWVGVNGKRVKNGINYFIISPTSVNDSNVGNGTIRNGQGWINDSDGSILVPESKVTAYRIFKTQNEEFVK